MRLINVAPMLEQLDLEHYDKDWYVSQYNADWIYSWLDSQPVIEAEPVKHGRWVDGAENFTCGNHNAECSVCHCNVSWMGCDEDFNYCPNCGAKMDLEG